jgi:hypothetical protein
MIIFKMPSGDAEETKTEIELAGWVRPDELLLGYIMLCSKNSFMFLVNSSWVWILKSWRIWIIEVKVFSGF